MAITGEIFRQKLKELLEESPSRSPELHVLVVDDNLVDRHVIERLLKVSSCKVQVEDDGVGQTEWLLRRMAAQAKRNKTKAMMMASWTTRGDRTRAIYNA
ncbi:two-component response regulator ARR5-like [Vigna radiata var. radiata]|uniref:Two-component response regulator ARR5-like n=1 Tax=Vigna radiata var. radiata TaxID=3916 RepID=A0A3Q0EPY6_VIGRR|nr:two-component response regulator ARR5-like [Vigna radiata var. radiata]